MQPASSCDAMSQSPFFRLPAELRNVIYKDVLGDLSNAFPCFGGVTYIRYVQYDRVSLLFVNKQMYQETHLLPYSMNSITAGPRTGFKEWMGHRTRDQLRALSRLHFVFDTLIEYHTPTELPHTTIDFGYSVTNNLAMESLLQQQLAFPELTGLKHVLIEIQSHAEDAFDLMEQIEFLEESRVQIKKLNPHAEVAIDLICLGCDLRSDDIPASSTTGLRIVRFDRVVEGGKSIHDILQQKGLRPAMYNEPKRMVLLRNIWQSVATTPRAEGSLDRIAPSSQGQP